MKSNDNTCSCVADPAETCKSCNHLWVEKPICDCVCDIIPNCKCKTAFRNETWDCNGDPTCATWQTYNIDFCKCQCKQILTCNWELKWNDNTCFCINDPMIKCTSSIHHWFGK